MLFFYIFQRGCSIAIGFVIHLLVRLLHLLEKLEDFIELSSDGNLKLQFASHLSSKFWLSVQKEYPTLAREALKKLLPFATTYLCETGSSRYVSTKTKYGNRLDAEADMYIQLLGQTLNIFLLLCKLILLIKVINCIPFIL